MAKGPSSSAEVRGLVIHDIKEVEGARQNEEQEDKRDEEGEEVNGDVEERQQSEQQVHMRVQHGMSGDLEPMQCAII